MTLEITYYTRDLPPSNNLLAQFEVRTDAPWGKQSSRGDIIVGYDGRRRVLWPKKGPRHFAATPATREETEKAEKMILANFAEWQAKR